MTVTAHDYRYTDRDVREDPRLTDLAIAYLQQYGGDFDPLVRAKRVMNQGGEMTTVIIRTVLNCMRHDVNVADKMPVPTTPFYIVSEQPFVKKVHKIKAKDEYRPPIELKTTWKKPYIAATTKTASAYHLLDPVLSSITYNPMTKEYRARPKAYCNAALITGILLDAPPEGRHLCRSCVKRKDDIDRRDAELTAEAARLRGEPCEQG